MTQEFDLAAALARGVEDRSGAWSFIQGFAAHWAGALGSGDGCAEAELLAAEERLGVRLPAALREAYLLLGHRRDLTSNHDVLLGPTELYVDEAQEALVFRHENQGAASWGILLGSLQEDDPAVFIRTDLADKAAERWEGWLERLSLSFVEIVLSESVQADEELCDFCDADDESIELLEEHCVQLPFPAYPSGEEEPGIRWFLGQDVLLRNDDNAAILARGRTAGDLDRLRELIPGDWLDDGVGMNADEVEVEVELEVDLQVVARVRVSSGRPVGQLACHPRLPLVAGLDSERPAVHVWGCEAGRLHDLGSIGAESRAYGDDAASWDSRERTPVVAWHPDLPLLAVAAEDRVVQWTPAGLSDVEGVPPTARYHSLAFSPDGRTLWASPSSGEGDDTWASSDVLDLAAGTLGTGPRWDTGVAEHPAGGLVATLASDQGATLGLFARVDHKTAPAVMRVLRRALILDADGYEKPIFSADGRHLAMRGNAYGNSLDVFEFPSLQRVLATTLGEPSPGYPYPQEWLEQMRSWSRHNIAFGSQPGVLWVGTPTGTLIEVNVDTLQAVEHDVLGGSPVSGLGATPTGELVIASGGGDLVLLSVRAGSAQTRSTDGDTSPTAAVAAFLDATSEIPDDGDLESHLVITDGARTWESDDLETVTTAATTDPTWLRLQAAINNARAQDE
ncbi:hypothetical protein ACWCPF_43085 [Streptomyces sp. NPDC001858]